LTGYSRCAYRELVPAECENTVYIEECDIYIGYSRCADITV